MSQERPTLEDLRDDILNGRVNRRDVLRRALALGLSAPVIAGLLAACGDDDDDDDDDGGGAATQAEGAATEAEEEVTEASEEEEETPTEAEAEETEAEGDATETEEEGDATGTETGSGAPTGEWVSSEVDPLTMDMEMEEGTPGGTLIEATFSDIATTHPVLIADTPSSDFLSLIFETLFEPHPDNLEPVGRLAQEWNVSEDGTTWTIRLREGVTWHDGEPLVADDVKFTYELHMNPETGSSYTNDISSKIDSVNVIDDQTVEFVLSQAVADFPLDLGVYQIFPQHVWADVPAAEVAQHPGATGQDPSMVIGTGPFMFEEWVLEDHASCVRNENYWGGAPYLDRFIYRVVADQSAGVQQLQTGDVDWMGGVPESSVAQFQGTDIAIHEYPTINFTFYGTNLDPEKTTLFQEPEVRKALLYALDRQAMIDTIRFGYGEVAIGTMPVVSWAYNPDGIAEENLYPYDPDMANQLLDEAGWALGSDGVRAKDGQRLAFTMYTNAGNQVREQYLTTIQEFWREIGVEMTPQLEPFPALVDRITTTYDFEVVLIGFSWSATPDQSTMWSCEGYGGGFNFVRYCNEEVDALLEEALVERDQDRRIELYTEMQNLVLADLPMAVLDFPTGISGVSPRVHNVFPSSVNERFNAHLWWIES